MLGAESGTGTSAPSLSRPPRAGSTSKPPLRGGSRRPGAWTARRSCAGKGCVPLCGGELGELVAKTQQDPRPEQKLSARAAAVPDGLALLHLSQLAPLVRARVNPGPSRTVAHHHGPAPRPFSPRRRPPSPAIPPRDPSRPPLSSGTSYAGRGAARGVSAAVGTGRRCPATWTRCSRLAFHRILADRRLPHAISPVLHRGCRSGSWPQRWKPHSRLAVLPARLLKIAAKPD